MPDRQQLERWLQAERHGEDDAADAAFTSIFASMPRIEPSAAFAEQAIVAARRWRARRRRFIALAWVAVLATVGTGVVIAWLFGAAIAPAFVKPIALGLSHATPWLVAYATEAMNLWWAVAGIATAIADALATPPRAGALVGAEVIGILAFFALQRVVAAERAGEMEL